MGYKTCAAGTRALGGALRDLRRQHQDSLVWVHRPWVAAWKLPVTASVGPCKGRSRDGNCGSARRELWSRTRELELRREYATQMRGALITYVRATPSTKLEARKQPNPDFTVWSQSSPTSLPVHSWPWPPCLAPWSGTPPVSQCPRAVRAIS